jgi:hypothetical protein
MDFPITDLLDEQACYDWLGARLYPRGLACPDCGRKRGRGVHRRHRAPVLDYQCPRCGAVFNAFPDTALAGTHCRPSELALILRGIARGEPTARLARELGCSRRHLLDLRHRPHHYAARFLPQQPLPDEAAEADAMYQNAGEKREGTPRSRRPAAAAR